jgi:hypothetical protein
LGAAPALAQPFTIPDPTPQYTSLTTLIPITTAHLASTTTLSGGGQTLTFSTSLTGFDVNTFGWTVWGAPPQTEGTPARVLATAINQTSLTITLSNPQNTFGFELEPANVGPSSMTVSFFNGATLLGTVTRSIPYNGARLMELSGTTPITSVQISAPGSGGFAMAQFRFGNALIGGPGSTNAVPALGLPELGALGLLLAGAGALLARRQQHA